MAAPKVDVVGGVNMVMIVEEVDMLRKKLFRGEMEGINLSGLQGNGDMSDVCVVKIFVDSCGGAVLLAVLVLPCTSIMC